jgi:hypothetical protein
MSGEHPGKEVLQRHHDGDLPEQDAAEVRQHVRACAQCEAELQSFARLGDMLRWTTDDAASGSDADFTRMFAEIERAVAKPPAQVTPLSPKGGGSSRWLQRAAPALGGLALAAAALLMVYRPEPTPTEPNLPELATLDISRHAEITAVKFGTNAGQVFGIPLSDGSSVPVVWIDDADDEEE